MTDKEFIRTVRNLCKTIVNGAKKLREIAEEENKRRCGNNPSDIDDECIDLTGGTGYASENVTLEDIEKGEK